MPFLYLKGDLTLSYNDTSLEPFVYWLIEQQKSKRTIQTYLGVLEKFKEWIRTINGPSLQHINRGHIQSYMDFLEKEQKSAGTIDKNYAAISVFTRFLGKPGLMLNITRKAKLKNDEIPNSLKKCEKDSLLKMVEADGNLRNIAIVYTLLQTGIRVSELCSLNNCDVEIGKKEGKVNVRNEEGKIDRIVPLSKEVREHLENYLDSLNNEEPGDALFVSSLKKRMTTRSVQYMLKKYNVNPHKLRHTFCQELVNNGIDIRIVAKLAGHRDINITKRYSRNHEADLMKAIDKTFA